MVEDTATQPVSALARESMLRMAGTWESLGQVNQAIDIYLRIVDRHPQTGEAEAAREKLVGLASAFERSGRYRLAMDLYERMERALRC